MVKQAFLVFLITALAVTALPVHVVAQDTTSLPLAEPGPYGIGVQTLTFVDHSRDDLALVTEIWYPATVPENSSSGVLRDAAPDTSSAPYPLIMYSYGVGQHRNELSFFTEHLASYGYVVVAIDHRDSAAWSAVIDRPLDMLFVLDQVTSMTPGDLAGIIDGDRVGVAGWSLGGLFAVLMGGARIDPEAWQTWCRGKEMLIPRLCQHVSNKWEEIAAYRSQFTPSLEEDDLWPSTTDSGMRAILSMAPLGGPILGDQGLDAVTVPVLIMAGTLDPAAEYERDVVFIYDQLHTEDAYLLTLVNAAHTFPQLYARAPILHFATAFFGYYLMGQDEYAEYLTAGYAEQIDDVVWGVYENE